MATSNRTVQFFKIKCGQRQSGAWIPFPQANVSARLQGLAVRERKWRLESGDGTDDVYCIVDRAGNYPAMRFSKVSYEKHPDLLLEDEPEFEDLTIPRGAGLGELCYTVFFEENILGIVKNRSVSTAMLDGYLLDIGLTAEDLRVPGFQQPKIKPLIRHETGVRLARSQGLRQFRMKIDWNQLALMEQEQSEVFEYFRNFQRLAEGGTLEVIVTVPRKRDERSGELPTIKDNVLDFVKDVYEAGKARAFDTLKVKSIDVENRLDPINLKGEDFSFKKNIQKRSPTSRSLKPEAAYEAIREAYNEKRDELLRAATIEVEDGHDEADDD